MRGRKIILMVALVFGAAFAVQAEPEKGNEYQPEKGSNEERELSKKERREGKKKLKIDGDLPMVLILGDSISIAYTVPVRATLKGKANIIHNPGNSQGTTHTLANIDGWLAMQEWDVIHFNLGLHDLKRVKVAGGMQNSNDPDDPSQADLETYTANLEEIVKKLKATEAKLVFATTTPFPAGVKPFRDPADVEKYNTKALKIMRNYGVEVNDLCALVEPKLEEFQKPKDVHFKGVGTKAMAIEVVRFIEKGLE